MTRSRGRTVLLAAALAAVAALGGVVPVGRHAASAATQVSWGGSPGPYTAGRIISEIRYNVEDERSYVSLVVLGPTVGRSPVLAGDQLVLVATELLMWGTATGWRAVDSHVQPMALSSGTLTGWPAAFHSLMPGYYLVRHTIVWNHSHVQVDYNHAADYQCIGGSPARPLCTPFTQGYIYIHPV